MKREILRTDDGQKMVVIRPRTPLLAQTAVAMASVAVAHDDESVFNRIPNEIGEYVFEGFLARGARNRLCIVNEDGSYRGELRPGDSFVGHEDLQKNSSPIEPPQ